MRNLRDARLQSLHLLFELASLLLFSRDLLLHLISLILNAEHERRDIISRVVQLRVSVLRLAAVVDTGQRLELLRV